MKAWIKLGLCLAAMGGASGASAAPAAQTVFINGKILTVDTHDAVAEAVAVKEGRIVFVGKSSDAKAHIGRRTEVVDLKGRTLMPGLVDGHMHPQSGGLRTLGCNLNYERLTREAFLTKIQTCLDAETDAPAERWLVVINWFQQDMIPTGYAPTRADLDTLKTPRPVMVRSSFGHSALVNSKALSVAKIARNTSDPKDGKIVRGADGEATGLLEDAAQSMVQALIPPPDEATNLKAAQIALRLMAEQGITTFLDAYTDIETLTAYQTLYRRGELTARGHFAVLIDAGEHYNAKAAVAEVVRQRGLYDTGDQGVKPALRVHTAKLFLDGVITAPAFTGVMVAPYFENKGTEADPHWRPGNHRGPQPYFTTAQLNETLSLLAEAGIDPHIHADGDGAVRLALDGVEALRRAYPGKDIRPAIAHAEIVDPADYARFAALNALPVLSFQWGKPAADTIEGARDYLGPYRHAIIEPSGLLGLYGARLTFGSDWPVDALDEWFALKVAVTRTAAKADQVKYPGRLGVDPGLTLNSALRAMTMGSAYALHVDDSVGSIEVGKLADLIVLDRDLTATDPEALGDTKVVLTMLGGKVVYRHD
ncbi:amidohydrolase [Asticcacaulis sp. AND118]|uniref:amidohydrolase n=1 Tax=Asticcacaulis sp. AND118 TaxID=2840468 RepID=UPI001CFF6B9C|nr:amidohydrolase [Asticcacaulis sp. AND118]UDF05445.1 amidohydrolase [Asticcacaulis sp. AND118]